MNVDLDAVADRHTLAAWLANTAPDITAERIRQWAKRGRIPRRGRDPDGRTLYRLGDVIEAHRNRHARGWSLPP